MTRWNDEESTGSGTFLLGALAGALVGAGVMATARCAMRPRAVTAISPIAPRRSWTRRPRSSTRKWMSTGAVPRQPWAIRRRLAACRASRSDYQC